MLSLTLWQEMLRERNISLIASGAASPRGPSGRFTSFVTSRPVWPAAVSAILALPKKQAVVVEAHVLDQVRDSSYYAGLLQVLESYFDD